MRGSWTQAVLSAGWGGTAFPGSLVSSVPPFPSPSRLERYVSRTLCLGQKQGGLVLEVGWRWGAEGGVTCQQGGHPKAREGEGGAGGCGAAAGVDCPAQLSAWGNGPLG